MVRFLSGLVGIGAMLSGAGSTLVGAERAATPASAIAIRDGFRAELLRSAQEGEDSWISMTFDDRGRLILGLDSQGLLRLTLSADPAQIGVDRIAAGEMLKHNRGVLYAHNSLYVCCTDGKGFYRLRDADGDDQFDEPELLKPLDYRSRYGHGANQIVAGPDGMLYVVIGNDVAFPEGADPKSPYRNPHNDWLLPNPHDLGQDDRVGCILRVDPDGKEWTVLAGGFRNQVDLAFNEEGEMFTWDADMEWDVGLPWYRPTRLNHVISGGEYGWRWGTGKWPAWYPDSLPTTLDTGLGSPTGIVFGTRSRWPERYRQALYMADWQHGRVLLVDFKARGATYDARSELFFEGAPLNVCDMEFGPDGDLYFITGGRGSQSGLYRVSLAGEPAAAPMDGFAAAASDSGLLDPVKARAVRRRLERLHVEQDAAALDVIWQQLGSADEWLRFAARVALENQPCDGWRARVAATPDGPARRQAVLALAHQGDANDQATILAALADEPLARLTDDELILLLRTCQLTLIRQGLPAADVRAGLCARLDPLFPHSRFAVNRLLSELLVVLDAPRIVERIMALLERSPTQEEQVQLAKTVVRAQDGWTEATRRQYLKWLDRARRFPGGKLVAQSVRDLRSDFTELLTDADRVALAADIARLDTPIEEGPSPTAALRPHVRKWAIDELVDEASAALPANSSPEKGEAALAAANCLRCHHFGDRGGQIGPDLSSVGRRFDARALLESILEPSRVIDPKYHNMLYLMEDGRIVTGRPTGVNRDQLVIETDPLTGASVSIPRAGIAEARVSPTSPMPQGLIDTLTRDEILDLLALLRRSQ